MMMTMMMTIHGVLSTYTHAEYRVHSCSDQGAHFIFNISLSSGSTWATNNARGVVGVVVVAAARMNNDCNKQQATMTNKQLKKKQYVTFMAERHVISSTSPPAKQQRRTLNSANLVLKMGLCADK